MFEITVIEGCRGTGKSSLAFKMRQMIPETTLVNPTGFHDDREKGLEKICQYYDSWLDMLWSLSSSYHDYKFVFDRFFFTEKIFSELYKEYDFQNDYNNFVHNLLTLSFWSGVKVNILFLTIENEEELSKRLNREKVPFGKAEENVKNSLLQQNTYRELFKELSENATVNNNFNIFEIDTTNKSTEEVYEEVTQLKTAN